MKHVNSSSLASQQGVVIVEVMVALLLFSVGVLAIVGLQATMLQNTTDSKYRAEAAYIAQQTIGQMWSNPADTNAGVYNTVSPIADLPNGSLSVTQPVGGGPFTVSVTWQLPGQDPHNFTTSATIVPCPPGVSAC
jgi:type IV pilus assembly protein PilV